MLITRLAEITNISENTKISVKMFQLQTINSFYFPVSNVCKDGFIVFHLRGACLER